MLIGLNQWRSPVKAHISSDASVKGQLKMGDDGNIVCDFPSRLILMANHQVWCCNQLLGELHQLNNAMSTDLHGLAISLVVGIRSQIPTPFSCRAQRRPQKDPCHRQRPGLLQLGLPQQKMGA
jgi:hypothetical protein